MNKLDAMSEQEWKSRISEQYKKVNDLKKMMQNGNIFKN